MNTDKVGFRYDGERSKHDTLWCVFTYRGKEYRVPYYVVSMIAELYGLPAPVREEIEHWAKMMHNPD